MANIKEALLKFGCMNYNECSILFHHKNKLNIYFRRLSIDQGSRGVLSAFVMSKKYEGII